VKIKLQQQTEAKENYKTKESWLCVNGPLQGIACAVSVLVGKKVGSTFFFQCRFSRRIWRILMASCLIYDPFVEWEDVANWSVDVLKGKSLQISLCKLNLGATVNHIWKQRNDLLHGNTPRTEEAIVAQIKWEVGSRIMVKGAVKKTAQNLKLVHSWNLHPLL
jgi:hypothetical protein